MMPATKHFDPVVGVDTHIILPPAAPPVPVPHPFVGMILDPMDYVPIVGSTVNINFLPRGLAGTQGIASPPHIPIGGTFVKPPSNECECFMGVSTINCDGDALCHTTLPALSCQCIGMPPIPRMRKKGAIKSLVLPVSVVLTIPAGLPVLISGPPTISLMALGMRLGMGALGKSFKKFKASKLGKKISGKADNLKSKLKKKTPSTNKGCGRPGEPVDVVTGANVDDFIDWESPELPHLRWQRFYSSLLCDMPGLMGRGFRHNWQHELTRSPNGFSYCDPEGEIVEFPPLDAETSTTNNDGFVLRLLDSGYQLTASLQPTVLFNRDERRTMLPQQLSIEGQRVEFVYDDQNRPSALTDEAGNQLRLAYNRDGSLERVALRVERHEQTLASYTYDDQQRLTVWTDALDHESRYTFDAQHRMTQKRDRNGYSYHYRYDDEGRCVHSRGDDGLYEIDLEYLTERLCTVVTWADGARFEYFYDELGVITKIVDPTGGVTLFETDELGNVIKQTEPNGDEVEFLYDQHGAHTRRVDASGQVLLPMHIQPHRPDGLAYELPSTPMGWTLGELASSTLSTPELLDQLVQQAMPVEVLRALGEPTAWEPALDTRKLDVLGRVSEDVDKSARTTAYNYDSNGNVSSKRDADGAFWTYHYKSWNLVDAERSPIGATTKYDYNLREEITRVVDPGGTVTHYEYDHCDRLTSVTRGDKLRDRYVYTAAGNLCEKYDADGELLLKLEPGPYDTHARIELADGDVYEYQHTNRARIAAVAGPEHVVKFEYDLFDQVKLDTRNGRGLGYAWSNPQTQTLTLLDKFQVSYRRTQQGVIELTDPSGGVTQLAADGRGRYMRSTADGLAELLTYDRAGLCTAQATRFPGGKHRTRVHTYSVAGDLLSSSDSLTGRTDYQYDAAHRLVAQRRAGKQEVFHHDLAGNLLGKPGLSGVRIGKANQLEAANDETFLYNQRSHIYQRTGNDGRVQRYKYNALDQLVGVATDEGFQWTAKYDGLNRRISKQWSNGYESHQVEFYWDHRRLAAEILDGQRLRIYIYGDRESFVPLMMVEYDSPQAQPASGRRYHLLSDQRGQIIEVINAAGRSVWQAEAQPYGDVSPQAIDDFEFNLRLPGQYADEETGLNCSRYRYYDPTLGRFIQSDPIGLAGGINTYSYPPNVLTHVDIEGLHPDQDGHIPGDRDGPIVSEKPKSPQGVSQVQFEQAGKKIREECGEISDDIVVQGSRASHTAKPTSDIDIAVKVPPDKFDDMIRKSFGTPKPGSAKERTMQHAIKTGKIQSGEAGLRPLRKQLEKDLGMDVDISVVKSGGPFDNGAQMPIPKGE